MPAKRQGQETSVWNAPFMNSLFWREKSSIHRKGGEATRGLLPGPAEACGHAVHGHEQRHVQGAITLVIAAFTQQLHLPEIGAVNHGTHAFKAPPEPLEAFAKDLFAREF